MARKTSGRQQTQRRKRVKSIRARSKRQKQTRTIDETSNAIVSSPSIENHRFISSMSFDGNTLITKTQKDDEPVVQRTYTKEQLAREIPIGKEMVDMYLDGEMPKGLRTHHGKYNDKNTSSIFRNVLISPADLGLLPPSMDGHNTRRRRHRPGIQREKEQSHPEKEIQERLRDIDSKDELEMVVNDYDDPERVNRKKHIFDLP